MEAGESRVRVPQGIVRRGGGFVAGVDARDVVIANRADAFTALDEIAHGGFWIGFLAYDLGRSVEHVEARVADDVGLPDLAFVRFDDVRALDAIPPADAPVALGRGTSSLDRVEHAARVAAIHELLDAGDCYQVNLTRRITFDGAPAAHDLFATLAHAHPAPHAGMCTFGDALPGVGIVSASPELFLRVDGRAVESRPIKGTAADAADLRASAKDHAENVMIVDLVRNDLGRVCEYGSVHVPRALETEQHPGLHHLVSAVQGTLRDEVSLSDLVRATFPAASITGAPKPRVMQAIEDLEPVRRGAYCGAFGWIDADHGRMELAVAIRTFTIAGGRTYFGVGGGIVADSTADAEWAETELKAAALLRAAGAYEDEPVAAR